MNTLITRTKIVVPRRPANLLTRGRLVDLMLDLLEYRFILVTAPAGYGKTSLLIDFAHQADMPVCWYSLDALDQDPQCFLAHFIASIAERFPNFGKQAEAILSDSSAHLDLNQLVRVIVNEAYEQIRGHFVIVLDDYHLVAGNKTCSAPQKLDTRYNQL
jgi:LuxR family maltose regulon positive regulatory protein